MRPLPTELRQHVCEFQSTHPCGVRPLVLELSRSWTQRFNPRTPAGCDGRNPHRLSTFLGFNPRTPAGCDGIMSNVMSYPSNPRTPAGCDTRPRSRCCWRVFNPRTLRVRHRRQSYPSCDTSFNPRTPAGCDAAAQTSAEVPFRSTFQSTHPCGVRLQGFRLYKLDTRFQSTHPCGVRRDLSYHTRRWLNVSIHAPLRGATGITCDGRTATTEFQSTHPCGVRPCMILVGCRRRLGFNPRTPAGCDPRT